jgi:hypothetical protein
MSPENEPGTLAQFSQSDDITELAKALLEAQHEIEAVPKNQVNPFFKSTYADLASILEAIKEPLYRHGLVAVQLTTGDGLTTMLMHTSGQFIRSTMNMHLDKQTPQGQGSGISYARRYMIPGLFNIPLVDDDGEAAERVHREPPKQKQQDYDKLLDNHLDAIEKKLVLPEHPAAYKKKYWGQINAMPPEYRNQVLSAITDKENELNKKVDKSK